MSVEKYEISNGRDWIDITDPSTEELDEVGKEYQINRHIIRDCLDPDHLPKHEKLGNYTFIVTRLASGNVKQHLDSLQELTTKVAIFYSDDFLITVHRLDQAFINTIKEEARKLAEYTSCSFVTQIIRSVLQSYEQPAMKLGEQVDTYESTVLLKHTKPALLQGLYYLKRKASTYKKVLLLTDDVINFLKTIEAEESEVQDVRDLYTKLLLLYDQVLDDVTNLMNTYLSLTAQKTNEVMKVLTIFSVFFLPLTFIAGVYGMNFVHMPELKQTWAYPAVLGLMGLITVAIFIMFKKRKWL